MDKRWQQVADLLVNYSTAVQPGERVMIAMGEVESYPLVHAVYKAVIQAGGYPQVQFLSEALRHLVMKHGNTAQIDWTPEMEVYGMAWADVYLGLRGAYNLYEHADIPSRTLAANQRAMGKVSTLRWQQTRWCLVRVPNIAFAQQAETDLETITDMFFDACLLDWPSRSQQWRHLADQLNQGSHLRLVGRGTDLSFSTVGRRWEVLDGKLNLPDGEIFTAPVEASVNGYITFELPGVLGGRLIPRIRLAWEAGDLTEANAGDHTDYFQQILATDEGARRIGEFGIGLNPYVTRFCKDILLDEKIGGTIHIALGRAYPECGGVNQSAIHWDIVKDLRQEGTLYLDGVAVMEAGQWLVNA
ncbi:MAG: aminopeptidase [Caldilineaceae bacterium]